MKSCYSCIISFLLWKYGYQASYFPNFTKNWLNWLKIFSNVKLLLLFYLHFCYLLFIIYISLLFDFIVFYQIIPGIKTFLPYILSQFIWARRKVTFRKESVVFWPSLVILKNFITPIYFLELWVCLLKILGLKTLLKWIHNTFYLFDKFLGVSFFFVLFFVFQI